MWTWTRVLAAALVSAIASGAVASSPAAASIPVQQAEAEHESPEAYAEWGNLAMREASKKHYEIRDYKYVGKKAVGPDKIERTFRFWVRKKGREFGLYVAVTYRESTKELLGIKYRETER